MAAVFGGTARVPIATLIMVAEMTGGYGLIVPAMLATSIAFVVQKTAGARFRYPRLYEAQVELRQDSPTHHESLVQAALAVLGAGSKVNLHGVAFPHFDTLLRLDVPVPIHNGQGELFAINVAGDSYLAGGSVAQAFREFEDLVAVAVIRNQQMILPRGATILEVGDRILLAGSNSARKALVDMLGNKTVANQDA
jgi:CIC family chloride channel protein